MTLRTFTAATMLLAAAACHKAGGPAPTPPSEVPLPAASEVESVIFLVGDVGMARWERSPLPRRLALEVESWSNRLSADSSVAVLFLGDNIYPAGLRSEPAFFATDSAHLEAQVNIVSGPKALANDAFGLFIAGNHDWGHNFGPTGHQRLINQEEFLARRRARGISVTLYPKAGTPGPGIIDVGRRLRFILLDTAWWLLSADAQEKARTMARLEEAMYKGRGREIIMAAHHPMKSASSHGGFVSLFDVFGIKWLLNKSGTSLQDLNSLPYRDLLRQLSAVFRRTGPPFIFAGGHDHSLQLIRAAADWEPRFMIVSGAGSKKSKIGNTPGMLYGNQGPGYMQLVFRKNGGIDLFIYGAGSQYLICGTATSGDEEKCVQSGIADFKSRYSTKLK